MSKRWQLFCIIGFSVVVLTWMSSSFQWSRVDISRKTEEAPLSVTKLTAVVDRLTQKQHVMSEQLKKRSSNATDSSDINSSSASDLVYPDSVFIDPVHSKPLWSVGAKPEGKELGDCQAHWHDHGLYPGCNCTSTEAQTKSKYYHPCCQAVLREVLEIVDRELLNTKIRIKMLLWSGAVFGWLRNGTMLPYDTDIDALVKLEDWMSPEFDEVLENLASKYGWCILVGYRKFFMKIKKQGTSLDIWAVQFKDGLVRYTYPTPPGPIDMFYPERRVTFEGLQVYMPNKPVEYSDHDYGKDEWRVPLWVCDEKGDCKPGDPVGARYNG